ncbi:hypothetical protein CERSUDRAFT_18702, partial [Gelatoporia subvermispora B]
DFPLLEWLPDIDAWLAEMIRLEGRGQFSADLCPKCHNNPATFRCEDCHDLQLYCKGCSVEMHRHSPLHRLREWACNRFRRISLSAMGLRIQLGHPVGELCTNPSRAFGDGFVLIDITGIHMANIDFCGCEKARSRATQLLQARIFPATSVEPRTGATFRVLEHFDIESAQAGVSAQSFYKTLARRTDNTGLDPPKDRYSAFLRIMREWRYLKSLKRSGRGHEPGGHKYTAPGDLAVLCPACPQPGKNLPEGWEDAPPTKRWLYRLFVGIDGNFRLKRRKVSSSKVDPCLTNGQAYFVDEDRYKAHIKAFDKKIKEEKNTCNNHDAAMLANIKGYESLAASGVVAAQCVRHEMKRPCSVGDLQRGERYVNVDFVLLESMRACLVSRVVISYDIACQWGRNFWKRVRTYGSTTNYDKETTFLVPKFHLPAHQASCQEDYSFNYTLSAGRTDGEAPERAWAITNVFGPSTKEMGPGSRIDLLNDVFGDHNWRKVARLPRTLLEKAKHAANDCYRHTLEFLEFSAVIPEPVIAKWTAEIERWEQDPNAPNPFAMTKSTLTQSAIRLQLAQEEAAEIQHGYPLTWHTNMSPSTFVTIGIELEEQHARKARKVRKSQSNGTGRRLDAWCEVQKSYVAGIDSLRSQQLSATRGTVHAENYSLFLPSAICDQIPCSKVLLDREWRLREGQAHEALDDLRQHLRLRTYLYKFKGQFVTGQRPTTRARSTIDNVQQRIDADAARYRAAHAAMTVLSRHLERNQWQATLRHLEDGDVRAISDGEIFESEGHRTMSWIWKVSGICVESDADEALQEVMRIEWCKARARAARFKEECELLEEEMRRVLQFHRWQGDRW